MFLPWKYELVAKFVKRLSKHPWWGLGGRPYQEVLFKGFSAGQENYVGRDLVKLTYSMPSFFFFFIFIT